MNKNSVKQRIFLSNTLMMFALLAIFLLINLAVIKIYGESIEHQFVNNASVFLTETEWKNFLKTWTIRQNQFILLFILDGVVCIFVLVAIGQFFTKNLVKHIMQPLEALNQGAQRVQENDLTQDIQNEGDREFETVCSTFNAMQKHILNEQEKNHKYEKARMDMLRGISHDLKTPLTAIQGSIKGILDGVVTTPDMQDKFLSAAYRRTKEMDGLLNQLFYLSALETGSLPMHFQAVELKEFLQTYMKMRQAECDDVVFCLDLPRQAFVRIDCQQMELQILFWFQSLHTPILDRIMVFITHLADGGILWLLLIGIFLIQPRTRFLGIVMFVCIVTDLLLCNGLLKNVFGRLRPCQVIHNVKLLIPQPSGASFPSGHTSISFYGSWCLILFPSEKVCNVLFYSR